MLNTMLRAHLHPFLHYKPMTLNSGHLLESPGQLLKTITGEATSWTNDIRMGVGRQEWGYTEEPQPGGLCLEQVPPEGPHFPSYCLSNRVHKPLRVIMQLPGALLSPRPRMLGRRGNLHFQVPYR